MLCPWAAGYLADGLVCGAAGVPGAVWCALLGRAAWCARGRWATWLMVLLVVLLVFQVPSGPTAREIATREPAARSGRSRSPPWPSGPSGTLHTGGACVAVTSPARPRPRAPQPGPPAWAPPPTGTAVMLAGLAVPFMPAGLGLAHCATVSKWAAMGLCGMRSWLTACRRRVGVSSSASPLRVAMRSRFAVVSCPKYRPPRRKTLKTGCYGRSGLRFERIGTCHSALLAREPAIASGNPLCRTSTRYLERGRGCPRSYERVRVRIGGPTCGLEGWRVRERSHVRNVGGTCD